MFSDGHLWGRVVDRLGTSAVVSACVIHHQPSRHQQQTVAVPCCAVLRCRSCIYPSMFDLHGAEEQSSTSLACPVPQLTLMRLCTTRAATPIRASLFSPLFGNLASGLPHWETREMQTRCISLAWRKVRTEASKMHDIVAILLTGRLKGRNCFSSWIISQLIESPVSLEVVSPP